MTLILKLDRRSKRKEYYRPITYENRCKNNKKPTTEMNLKYIKNMSVLFNVRKYIDVICVDGI